MSILVGHFVSSPGGKEIEETVVMKERDREESEGKEEITKFPLYPCLPQGQQALPNWKPVSVWRPGDKGYRTASPNHPCLVKEFSRHSKIFFHKMEFDISCKLYSKETECKATRMM